MSPPRTSSDPIGVLAAVATYVAWGAFPLYWRQLASVPAFQILAHRSFWSLVFVGALVMWRGELRGIVAACSDRRVLITYLLSGCLLAVNWVVSIWGVNHAHAIEVSLGYFITPLVNVALGVVVLRERLRPLQAAAVALAFIAVVAMTVVLGTLPWVALALAGSFGSYGLVRKMGGLDPFRGLLLETAWLAPFGLGAMIYWESAGNGAFLHDGWLIAFLLIMGGAVTSIPLIWYARAMRTLRLSTMGLLLFITPSCQFAVALGIFHEPLSRAQSIAFPVIWLALCIYIYDAIITAPRAPRAPLGDTPTD